MRRLLLSGIFVLQIWWPAMVRAQTPQQAVDGAVAATLHRFETVGLQPEQLAVTLVDLHDRDHPTWGSFHGDQVFYPASVVKLFYLVAAHAWMEQGKIQETPELDRALHDMIVTSSNDATQLVFSMLTGTTGGWELTPAELGQWLEKREVVNRYFHSLGFPEINVNQPTFAEDPYGRERQARGAHFENNNRLSTDAVARLWLALIERKAVTPQRSDAMLELLRRDPFQKGSEDEQATNFGGKVLPPGSKYYSKAGWTSIARHDSAWVRLPNGAEYIYAVFTRDHAKDEAIVPFFCEQLAANYLRQTATVH